MPKTIADARIKTTILTKKPTNWKAPTAAELNAGIHISSSILKSDYKFAATASDTIDEAPLSAAGNAKTLGAGNFEASFTVFRYIDPATGKADLTEDAVYQAMTPKGTELYVYERTGALHEKNWAAGDVFTAAIVETDNPQKPSDLGGYIKSVIPLGVQDFVIDAAVAGS